MNILICNAGSTSLKFCLYEMPAFRAIAQGRVERVGSPDGILRFRRGEEVLSETCAVPDYAFGIRHFLSFLGPERIDAVGYKTVLAKGYPGVHELTEDVLDGMRAYYSVAPAHNGPYLQAIGVLKEQLPGVRHIGVFETAFHRSIPESRRVFPIPYEWTERYGIRRMGYHGASHGYIAEKLARFPRVISCHLGGSGSLCAILNGKSVDNSFGFSLQMGILHASRTGDTDPFLVPYLIGQGLSVEEIFEGLGKNGGLKGISGTSGDLREVETALEAGSVRARLAVDVYVTYLLRYIGAYTMELGGLDAIAFTGGIGENSARIRSMVLGGMAHMGVLPDEESNRSGSGERRITREGSAVEAWVIPANEEFMVARSAYQYLNGGETV